MVDKTRKIFCDTVLGRPVRVCSYTARLEDDKEALEHAVADEMLRNERAEAENARLLELAAQLEEEHAAAMSVVADRGNIIAQLEAALEQEIGLVRGYRNILQEAGVHITHSDVEEWHHKTAQLKAENEQLRAKIAGVDCGECGESMMDCECDFDALAKELDGE